MERQYNPTKILREMVDPIFQRIAREINLRKGSEGYRAKTGNHAPRTDPRRPIVDARSLSIYQDNLHICTVSVFLPYVSNEFFIGDLDTIGFKRINIDEVSEENIEAGIRDALHF